MADPEGPSPLVRPLSALRRAHAEACRLGRQRGPSVRREARVVIYGDRRLRFPLLALTTSQELGPARHALEQRIVAGFTATPPPGAALVASVRGPKKG